MEDKDLVLVLFKVILLVGFIIEVSDIFTERGAVRHLSIFGAICTGTMLVLIM